jgi:hypothetical protein
VTALGCGSSSPTVSGIVDVTLHQAGKPDSSPTPWFGGSDIALASPPGGTQGYFGTCIHGSSMWIADLHLAGSFTAGIHAMRLTVPDAGAEASISITLDQGSFAGTCSVAASRFSDSPDLGLSGLCMGLSSGSDPHTADASLAMSVTSCTGL